MKWEETEPEASKLEWNFIVARVQAPFNAPASRQEPCILTLSSSALCKCGRFFQTYSEERNINF